MSRRSADPRDRMDPYVRAIIDNARKKGFLTYDDLSIIEPDDLMEMGGLTEEQVNHIVEQAEERAEAAEKAADEARRRQREQERNQAAEAAAAARAEAAAEEVVAAAVEAEDSTETEDGSGQPETPKAEESPLDAPAEES